MARIEEYLPQVGAEGPVGGTSPLLEQVGQFGRGLQEAGAQVEQGGELIYRRQAQAESADASAAVSESRANYSQMIDEQTNNGTLDTRKLMDQYDKDMSDVSDRLSTGMAKDFFERQQNRLRASLLIKASRGQSMIAGNNARMSFNTALNNDMATLQNDPSQFADIHDSNIEKLNQMQESGVLPQAEMTRLQASVGKQLSQAAVRGHIQSDYNSAVGQGQQILQNGGPNAIPKAEALMASMGSFNSAQQMMDSGVFDSYLNSNDKKALAGELKTAQSAAYTEINRQAQLAKGVQSEKAQNWADQNFAKLKTSGLSTDAILKSPMTWQQKNEWIRMAQEGTKAQYTDPATFNATMSNIVAADNDPNKITDPYDIYQKVGRGLSIPDAEKLVTFLDKTPSGQADVVNRKQLLDVAKANLVKGGGLMGVADPDGEYHLSQFTQDLQKAESSMRAQKKPVSSLYDTSSPDYFGSPEKFQKYTRTMQEILQDSMNRKLGVPSPQGVYAPPGASPSPSKPSGPKRNPGESPADFLKRIKGGG